MRVNISNLNTIFIIMYVNYMLAGVNCRKAGAKKVRGT